MFYLLLLQLVQSNFVLFCTYAADLRDHFQNIVLTILVSQPFHCIFITFPFIFPYRHYFSFTSLRATTSVFLNISEGFFVVTSRLFLFYTSSPPCHETKPISLTHESSRLLPVYAGFCCDKHTAVAVVPAEVWEEDGSFLRYHSECTVVISVRPLRGHALMCVPSCGRCWERCIIVSTTDAHLFV